MQRWNYDASKRYPLQHSSCTSSTLRSGAKGNSKKGDLSKQGSCRTARMVVQPSKSTPAFVVHRLAGGKVIERDRKHRNNKRWTVSGICRSPRQEHFTCCKRGTKLIDLLFEQPYCKISFLVERGIAKEQTASRYLRQLTELGELDRIKRGRENYYINKSLWRILTHSAS